VLVFSNAEPNQLYSRRDFSILVEDDLPAACRRRDRVDDELVEQLAVDGDREPRRCGGGAEATASANRRRNRGRKRGLAPTRPAKPSRRDPNE